MNREEVFLRAIRADPRAAAPRLVYADWLEDTGDGVRADLVRAAEAMRAMAVYTDEYWRLKARRNELRPQCAADWLAAMGYDGSRYDPLFHAAVPDDWKGRWRLIREFTERWFRVPMGDVGGRQAELRAEEERLGRPLPPSVRELVAYELDLGPGANMGLRNFEPHLRPMDGHSALSVLRFRRIEYPTVISFYHSFFDWAVQHEDLGVDDPPVRRYVRRLGGYDAPEREETPPRLSDIAIGDVFGFSFMDYERGGVYWLARRCRGMDLQTRLDAEFPNRLDLGGRSAYEGDGLLVRVYPGRDSLAVVWQRPGSSRDQVPAFIWDYAHPKEGWSPLIKRNYEHEAEQDRRTARLEEARRREARPLRRALNAVRRWFGR